MFINKNIRGKSNIFCGSHFSIASITIANLKHFPMVKMSCLKGKFPYNELLQTRHGGYHCKWLLVKVKNHGVLFHSRGFFLLLTGAIPNEILQNMITSKTAFPLPQEYSEMADCLEWWGRAIDGHWEQDVLGLMYLCLEEGMPVQKSKLFEFSIGILVDMKIQQRSPCDIPFGLKDDWIEYFETEISPVSSLVPFGAPMANR